MLGLLRGSNGQEAVPSKNETKEMMAMTSPNPSLVGDLRPKKRNSIFPRPLGTIRASFGRFTSSFVKEQHEIVQQKCRHEFGASVSRRVFDTSYDDLYQWIKSERLKTVPHKGGSWDRVLIAVQYFADQVFRFNQNIEGFMEESGAATNFVFGQCLLLLELGHENAVALEKVFSLFYQFGLELAPLLRRADVFIESQSIMEDLGKAFGDLLQIVTGISITLYQAVHGRHESVKIDIFASFSSLIDNFRSRVHHCCHEMWNVILMSNATDACRIDKLQTWLSPQDSVLAFLSSNHISLAGQPEQFTCTWFQSQLSNFIKSKEKIMLVEGGIGHGKSTLATWVNDRLQRPIARKHVSTLSFFYNYSVMSQSTTLDLLKTLLHQLLLQFIGDLDLFAAINEVYVESKTLLTSELQEKKLWHAFDKALKVIGNDEEETLAIIVDGISSTEGQKVIAQQACKKLYEIAHKHASVRLFQFSQPLDLSPSAAQRIKLSSEDLLDDIRTTIRSRISLHDHFKDRDFGEQETIIEHLAESADGNMLWSSLTCELLQLQNSCKEFDATLKTVLADPKTIAEAVKKLLIALKLTADCKTLLSLLVAAERPLQFSELEALLRTEPEYLAMNDKTIQLQPLLNQIASFIIVGEGLVSLRHSAIKQALITLSNEPNLSLHLKERQKDLVLRLLIYTKAYLRGEQDPTFTMFDVSRAESKIRAHCLLEYAIRYWTVHFKKSSLYKAQGDFQLPKDLKKAFSGSVMFCMLEQACWNAQSFPQQALELHNIAFRVRKAIFGQDHVSVLQSILFCAMLCETYLSRHTDAVEWYGLAARISRTVCGVQADVTIACCNTLLRISSTLVTKKRSSIMTYREEVLLILVSSYKHRYGSTSKELLEVYQKLSELYTYMEEETKAVEIIQIIQQLTGAIYGAHSDQGELISRKAEIELKKYENGGEIEVFDGFLFGGYVEETEESFTLIRVEIILKLAAECVIRGEFEKAEELYIELWMKLNEYCRSVHICEWHEKKIQVMIIYARFLEKQKRITEAGAILLAVWTEYEHHEFSMFESIVILLKDVAICIKTLGLLTIALTIFQKCWSFFKHQHKENTSIFKEIEQYISQTSTEVVKSTVISTTTINTSSEIIVREVFESSITSTTTEISETTVELCQSLSKIYIKEERWFEAITCIKKTLMKSWSSFFSESIESINMAKHFSSESVELAVQLAVCYTNQKRFEKAEEIYIRLYRAHRKGCRLDSVTLIQYSEMLLAFYSTHQLFTKAISFYQELLVEYRAFYGASHTMTIKILYILGDICRKHHVNYGYWLEYYLEIVTTLNEGAVICHEEALQALIIVAEHYYETLRFSESLGYFKSIFMTFYKHGKNFKYFEKIEQMQILIEHYFRSLEETKIDIHMHVTIIKELREACLKYYGESSTTAVNVTVTLAEICCRNEKYELEATSYYEHVIKHSSSLSKEVIRRTQTTLKTLYIKQITSTKTTTTVSKETMEKATTLLYERYVEIRKTYSCTHELTLTHLRELVTLYHKQQKIELATKELKSIMIECITKVTSAKELIETASVIASIYISCGLVTRGLEIVRELKLQVIYKSNVKCSHFGFDVTKLGRVCFAFIASFEYSLHAVHGKTLAMYMSDLVAESLFYERFIHYVKIKSKLQLVFMTSARLRLILARSARLEDFWVIEQKVLEYFSSMESSVLKVSTKSSVAVFVNVLLKYFSAHSMWKSWTSAAGFAAVSHIRLLLDDNKHKEALELTNCAYRFLMAHEGLDDPTEITLGFQLCLMMAGRTSHNRKCSDPVVEKAMMDLSRQILAEVLGICKKFKFNIARCQLTELNELIILIGEQKDFKTLQWLLETLWSSREGQSTWPQETIINLGRRLVQAEFSANNTLAAIRLCEDILYNVRRVQGPRHYYVLSFHALLATMYTSLAVKYRDEATLDNTKNKKRAEEIARLYFKKAVTVHEDVLKLIVNLEDADLSDFDDEDGDDGFVDGSASHRGSVINGHTNGVHAAPTCGFAWKSREQEIDYVRAHIRRLQLAMQRFGGWHKPLQDYEKLTSKVWSHYGKELKLGQENVLASKWKIDGFGLGRAEGDVKEDGFKPPEVWWIVSP